jgi:TonB-dependent SusC/RagA subfamily outer membrane receptor
MASSTLRVAFCALLVGLLPGCATSIPVIPAETGKPAIPTPELVSPPAPPPAATPGTMITGEELDRAGNDPIEKTLEAKVPGIIVSRAPDGSLVIRIRGNSSINGNMEPLYVIDGMAIQPGPGGALSGINPHDIASIEVLKDAASLSFYGLRAANGVILIKTKHSNASN